MKPITNQPSYGVDGRTVLAIESQTPHHLMAYDKSKHHEPCRKALTEACMD